MYSELELISGYSSCDVSSLQIVFNKDRLVLIYMARSSAIVKLNTRLNL